MNSKAAFVTLAKEKGLIGKAIFSLCFSTDGGYISFGNIFEKYHTEPIKYTSYQHGNMYQIKLKSYLMESENGKTKVSTNYYSVIDSGTTLTYMPSALNNELINKIGNFCSKFDCKSSYSKGCFKPNQGKTKADVIKTLPKLFFYLGENEDVEMVWLPRNYITADESDTNKFCIGTYSWK